MEDKDKQKFLFDIESDNLLDDITKIHCLAYCDTKTGLICSTSYQDQIKDFFLQKDVVFIGHNIVGYDIPAVEKIFGIKVEAPQYDTLGLSWLLSPERNSHSLESWGEFFSIPKIKVEDWKDAPISLYISRCETDVRINYQLWKKQASYLNQIYSGNHSEICRFLRYIHMKLDAVKEHQEVGLGLDVELCKKSLEELEALKEEKVKVLEQAMPKRAIKSVKFPPKIMYKKDGSPSENRIKWLKFLEEHGKPEDFNQEVEFIHSYEAPNVNSNLQVKTWLESLNWSPLHYKYVREEGQREMRKIPQIKARNAEEGELCESVIKLIEKEPSLEALEALSILSHRIGLLRGFLSNQKNGKLYQGLHKLTNTMRLSHSTLVNLPLPYKKYAGDIRKSLIAGEGNILVGTDLASIENKIRDHFVYPLDREYIEEMQQEGFDSHLDISLLAGFLTKEQCEEHKLYEKTKGKEGKSYKEERQKAKTVNYAAQYGVGKETLSRNSGLSVKDSAKLLEVYWKRNWAAKKVAEEAKVIEVNGSKWLFNPISGFYYNLRAEKDRLSTLVQSSSAYTFDIFMKHIREQGLKIAAEWHDEACLCIPDEEVVKESVKNKIQIAIDKVNKEFKLNVKIQHSLAFGYRYSEIH